jgi:predicted lipase
VIFTGHSLGGALAALAAAQTRVEGWRESGQITLYTFGQPRIGDYNFAIAHSHQIPNRFFQINIGLNQHRVNKGIF